MKRLVGIVLASLIAFNANAGEPELWTCRSTNIPKEITLYLIYRKSDEKHHDFMLFSAQGGLLGLGPLDLLVREGMMFLTTRIKFTSGVRELFLSPLQEDRGVLLQIFAAGNADEVDLFVCK